MDKQDQLTRLKEQVEAYQICYQLPVAGASKRRQRDRLINEIKAYLTEHYNVWVKGNNIHLIAAHDEPETTFHNATKELADLPFLAPHTDGQGCWLEVINQPPLPTKRRVAWCRYSLDDVDHALDNDHTVVMLWCDALKTAEVRWQQASTYNTDDIGAAKNEIDEVLKLEWKGEKCTDHIVCVRQHKTWKAIGEMGQIVEFTDDYNNRTTKLHACKVYHIKLDASDETPQPLI